MIFVTVGTHEQPFNRLVEYMDLWASNNNEEVVIQTGFSTYEPKYCSWNNLYTYEQMINYVNEARIVITHGGPSSFIMPLQIGKVPIVVPRKFKFDEHVNNHQVSFCRAVTKRLGNIVVVENVDILDKVIMNYDKIIKKMINKLDSNNDKFCQEFQKIVSGLFEGENDHSN